MSRRRNHPLSGGPYRWINTFDTAWEASPVIPDPPDVFDGFPWNPTWVHEETGIERARRLGIRPKAKTPCGSFWSCLKDLFTGSSSKEERMDFIDMGAGTPPCISPKLWKAYGYWARPTVNRVPVHNATPGPVTPSNVDPLAVFNNLIGPHGSPHPERWVPRLQHPALPPRPDLPGWQTPPLGSPLAFPWECALNPFLVHSPVGRAPVTYDVGLDPSCIIYSETGPDITIPISDADRAQPATYPFLTIMEIREVADDTAPLFPWPMWVINERGITVQDVFEAISYNFSLHVSGEEFASWDERRQAQAGAAYWRKIFRNQAMNPHRAVQNDGLRRVDYLGDRVMFRGLEPSPRMDGTWMLFVGSI